MDKAARRMIRNRESAQRSRRKKREQLQRLQLMVDQLMDRVDEQDAELQQRSAEFYSILPFVRRVLADQALRDRWAEDLRGRPQREQCIATLRLMVDHLEYDSFTVVAVKQEPPAVVVEDQPPSIKIEDFFANTGASAPMEVPPSC